ncbi:hypothetical protein V8E53_004811 [Lactarius tabidus]
MSLLDRTNLACNSVTTFRGKYLNAGGITTVRYSTTFEFCFPLLRSHIFSFNVSGSSSFHWDERGTGTISYPGSKGADQEDLTDGSKPLFNKYLKIVEDEDKKMTDSWKADADGILVFTGLFSASVAALLAVSIGDLRPSSQDTSAFYLQNIYQLLSDPNRSSPTILLTPSIPPAFSPPNYAVWVNSLWSLSLAISLTCGLQATLLQQWARRYTNITQSSHIAHRRARIRAFFSKGVDTLHLPWVVEALPTLLHLSLFLFFAGLIIYLFNINHTVFTVVAWWVGFCTATYVGVTLMPLFRHDSPYYAPLSSSAWYLVNGALYVIVKSLRWLVEQLVGCGEICARLDLHSLDIQLWCWFYFGIRSGVQGAAMMRPSEADSSVVQRVFAFSDEDLYLEEFLTSIPGFFKSKFVTDAQHIEIFKNGRVSKALLEFMNRTLSSHTLPDEDKRRRIAICRKVMDNASLPVTYGSLYLTFDWEEFLCSIDSGLVLKAASYDDESGALHLSQYLVSVILESVQKHDDVWCKLAAGHLGVSESALQYYLAKGDSASLANLNCVLRRAIDSHQTRPFYTDATTRTLERISKIDVQGTLPELRDEFCTLWNELVLMSRAESPSFLGPNEILTRIRHIYIALHPSTVSTLPTAFSAPTADEARFSSEPPSYPLCTAADHHSGSASQVHGDVVGTTDSLARTSPTMFGGDKTLDFGTPTDDDAQSSPTPSPYHANIGPANKHSLDDIPAAPRCRATSLLPSSFPAAQMSPANDEGRHSPINPFDSTATLVIRNGTYTDTIVPSPSRTSILQTISTPILPLSSISHSNRTASPQQVEESTADPLSTFSYPPPSSILSFPSNAPPASAFSGLPTSAGGHIPAIIVTASSDSNTTSRRTAVGSDERGK